MAWRTAYCTLANVKRYLSVQERKIKFSDQYQRLEWSSENQGNGRLSGVTISDAQQGHQRFTIAFSDATNFTFTGEDDGYLGDGSRGVDFTSNDGLFTIEASRWSGTIQANDEFYFEAVSNVSIDNAIAFMEDALLLTNGKMRPVYSDATNIPWYSTANPIPGEIILANQMLASCYIFKAAFVGASEESMPVVDWCKEGEGIIDDFVEDLLKTQSIPQWRSREAHVQETGIAGVEDGILDEDDTGDNESYSR